MDPSERPLSAGIARRSRDGETSIKRCQVYETLKDLAPDLVVDGDMHGDLATIKDLRERYVPKSLLESGQNP
jgi:malate dehydrogenase (oxaloacetate-decarboxylating)(NADP+)